MVVYGMVMSLVLLSPLGRSKGKKHQDLSSARDMEREKKKNLLVIDGSDAFVREAL